MATARFKSVELDLCDANGVVIESKFFNVDTICTVTRSTDDVYTLIETTAAGGKTYKVIQTIEEILYE